LNIGWHKVFIYNININQRMDQSYLREYCKKLWDTEDMKQLMTERSRSGNKKGKFVDGPPFVSGSLHHGHICIGVAKDFMLRYLRMNGFDFILELLFDTHGLPVESAVNREHGIQTKDDMQKVGKKQYNHLCKDFVTTNSDNWKPVYELFGRWCDFDHKHMTMDLFCMEKFWEVFAKIYEMNKVYIGYKVMPYSTKLHSPISNTESSENYKTVNSPSIFVKFKVIRKENTYFIAWTTTPWTLPSNLALCVKDTIEYVYVKDHESSDTYILSKNTLKNLYAKKKNIDTSKFTILETVVGKDLIGMRYEPLFGYFGEILQSEKYFVVLNGEHVKDATEKECIGTGIVHTAPGFGIDDHKVCLDNGLITMEENHFCPIDESGCYTDMIIDRVGKYAFEENNDIISVLKGQNMIIKHTSITHQYPYCPRTNTPLMYKLSSGVFINVVSIKDRLLELGKNINWSPEYVRTRYDNWIENTVDWCVSRDRVFGTPIPMWVSKDGKVIVVSSAEELRTIAQFDKPLTDIHPEFVDDIVIVRDGVEYRRVPYVFDCWFESGSMTMLHDDEATDFVIEGIDQANNWFYNSAILFALLKDDTVFKNIICTGLVLAEDGKKMSKRAKNYPDPTGVLVKYGADACRMYICNSAVIHGENLPFSLAHLDKMKNRFAPWYNSLVFFREHYKCYTKENGDGLPQRKLTNIMDRWLFAKLNRLISTIKFEMDNYRLYNVFPLPLPFIDALTNWYLKMNRDRLRGQVSNQDWGDSLYTLYTVLLTFSKVMAPMTPFITEYMFNELKHINGDETYSVHLCEYPNADFDANMTEEDLNNMTMLHTVIEHIREVRCDTDTHKSVKMPIKNVTVYHPDEDVLDGVSKLSNYIHSEGNVLHLEFKRTAQRVYSIDLNYKVAGKKYKQDKKKVVGYVSTLSQEDIIKINDGESLNVMLDKEYVIEPNDVKITVQTSLKVIPGTYLRNSDELYITIDPGSLEKDHDVKEKHIVIMINYYVQQARKDKMLKASDNIELYCTTDDFTTEIIRKNNAELFAKLNTEIQFVEKIGECLHKETIDIAGHSLMIGINKL
jgi:isoleucyl-tRNA synthetase